MSEMVERVARVMWEDLYNTPRVPHGVEFSEEALTAAHEVCRHIAREIVDAMREPTEQMIATVSDGMYHHFTTSGALAKGLTEKDIGRLRDRLRKAAADTWRSMIDAALKE